MKTSLGEKHFLSHLIASRLIHPAASKDFLASLYLFVLESYGFMHELRNASTVKIII